MNWLIGGTQPKPMGNSHPNVVPYRNFPVADGEVIIAVGNDSQFRSLCKVLGDDSLGTHPDYATNAARTTNREALEATLRAHLAHRQRDEVIAAMEAAGVPGGPINSVDQVFEDPQVKARKVLEDHHMPDGTPLPLVRFPARLSATPATIRRTPPAIGANTHSILTERLGLDAAETHALEQAGVIRGKP